MSDPASSWVGFDYGAIDGTDAASIEVIVEEAIRRERAAIRRRAIADVLAWLCAGARDAETIGRKALVFDYLSESHLACGSQRQLAERMGLSLGRVNAIVASVEADLPYFPKA